MEYCTMCYFQFKLVCFSYQPFLLYTVDAYYTSNLNLDFSKFWVVV
eukprot:UN02227